MRVVLDTNVIVSGLFFGGIPRVILNLIETKDIIPCFVPSTFKELHTVLEQEKFDAQRSLLSFSIEEFLAAVKNHALVFDEPPEYPARINEDPSDNKFLACAVAAGAFCIISGDRHLLAVKNFRGIPILTPSRFLTTFQNL